MFLFFVIGSISNDYSSEEDIDEEYSELVKNKEKDSDDVFLFIDFDFDNFCSKAVLPNTIFHNLSQPIQKYTEKQKLFLLHKQLITYF